MAGCEAVYSLTNIDGIQNFWSCTFVLSYLFVERCLTKDKNNFTYVYNSKIESKFYLFTNWCTSELS